MFKVLFALIAIVLAALVGFGQLFAAPMTNADVVKMGKAGLPEETIIVAIGKSATHFDTSTTALITLKGQGLSSGVLNAMLQAGKASIEIG